jgi:hypothetical protein
MEVLILDGKSYVKASKAAKELGYATDYVGQLCRGGKVDAHLIGRTWYVNKEELSTHKVEKKRISRVKAREYAKKSIEEHRVAHSVKTQNAYKHIAIQYEHDDEVLIPDTKKKLGVRAELSGNARFATDEGDEMQVLNKGEKVRMSGAIPITDVSEDAIDHETTVLHPSAFHTSTHDVERTLKIATETEKTTSVVEPEIHVIKTSFRDKLVDSRVHMPDEDSNDTEEPVEATEEAHTATRTPEKNNVEDIPVTAIHSTTPTQPTQSKASIFTYTLFFVFISMLASLSIMTIQQITYTPNGIENMQVDTTYGFSTEAIDALILSKI